MPLPDWLAGHRDLIHCVPFLGIVAGQRAADRPLLTRTAENVITAVLAAGLVMWKNDSLQDFKLETIQRAVAQLQIDTRAELVQLRADVAALRVELAHHETARVSELSRSPRK